MSETATVADRVLLFDKDVPIGEHFLLHVSRYDEDDGTETIRGSVLPLTDFGDWRNMDIGLGEHANPPNRDVEVAVGTAISFPVRVTGHFVEQDNTLVISFRRAGPAVDRNGEAVPDDATERLAEIRKSEVEVATAKKEMDDAEEASKDAREKFKRKESAYEETVANLRAIINQRGPGPLFEKPSTNGHAAAELEEEEEDEDDEDLDEDEDEETEASWESTPMDKLGLPEDVIDGLERNGVKTLGDWCDKQKVPAFAGISADVRSGINDMVQKWFTDHPEHVSAWNAANPPPEPPPNGEPPVAAGPAAEATSKPKRERKSTKAKQDK